MSLLTNFLMSINELSFVISSLAHLRSSFRVSLKLGSLTFVNELEQVFNELNIQLLASDLTHLHPYKKP